MSLSPYMCVLHPLCYAPFTHTHTCEYKRALCEVLPSRACLRYCYIGPYTTHYMDKGERALVEESEDLATRVPPAGLLVVHDAV